MPGLAGGPHLEELCAVDCQVESKIVLCTRLYLRMPGVGAVEEEGGGSLAKDGEHIITPDLRKALVDKENGGIAMNLT